MAESLKQNFVNSAGATQATFVPTVIDNDGRTERAMDILSRLVRDRIISIDGPIDDATAAVVTKQLLFLEMQSSAPISLYINSPGGSISAGMAIVDTMNQIKAPVHTYGLGMCASMGSFILSAGKPGQRYVLPNTKVMIHQPLSGTGRAQQTEMDIAGQHIKETRREMESYYADFMGVDYATFKKLISATTERDNWLNATMATKMGLVDHILNPALTALEADKAYKQERYERALSNHKKELDYIKRAAVEDEEVYGFTLPHRTAILEIIAKREAAEQAKAPKFSVPAYNP